MKRVHRWLACLLTICMIISNFTLPIFATEEQTNNNEDNSVEVVEQEQVTQEENQTIETQQEQTTTLPNVALRKHVTAKVGAGIANRAVDGNLNTYWDGGKCPSELLLDLKGYYDVECIKVIPYFKESRYYHYEVYTSVDGVTFEKIGEKKTNVNQTQEGETFTIGKKTIKFVKVVMLYDSANPSAHINELEVYGLENKNFDPTETPQKDPTDSENIAFNKPTRSTSNQQLTSKVVDGQENTFWSGQDYPKFVDVDLLDNYDINKIQVAMPIGPSQFAYTVYGSVDGVHFTTIAKTKVHPSVQGGDVFTFETPVTYRVIRVNVTANSKGEGANSQISEIKVFGQKSATQKVETRKELHVTPYETWLKDNYQVDVNTLKDASGHYRMEDTYTNEDVYNEVKGVITRLLGADYVDWFTFELAPATNGKDYYELSSQNGKIHIKGNEGISLTTGLNYFLKYYCNVHISQQTKQVKMPTQIPVMNEVIRKESPYEIRYAYNYCTLSYTMPFWGYDEWQRELDYFALNGVNLILDTTATEALWVEYLQNYGYNADQAKEFVCGYAYKAWWLMGNLESYGGPVSDEWILDTVQMARINQRKMTVLGMQPCLQGFMGAMPEHFADIANDTLMNTYGYEDIKPYMVKQGAWSGFTRPPLLKTTYNGYNDLAKKFYDTQELIYGQITNYYAGDLAHEGGIIPPDLSKPEMSAHILKQMMSYDQDAVWVIQSWLSNPNPEILEGFKENKQDHVMVLDLCATESPHWSNTKNWNGKEFGGTSWVYCMLDNYGGRQGMHGELKLLATQITKARRESKYMKGIGITPEGTLLNPVNYDLFWEMGWEDADMDTNQWLKNYITRRYGSYNENLWQAWTILLSTAYGTNRADGSSKNHKGNVNCITNMKPNFEPTVAIGSYKLQYDPIVFENAMKLFMSEYETFKNNECYIYDCVDILRQTVANSQVEIFKRVVEGYENNNREIFTKYKDKLLNSILLLDEISGFEKDSLYGTWIQKARNFTQDSRNSSTYDDYSKDMMEINAKAIVNVWSSKALQTYAHRQYAGLEKDYNYPMWKLWLDSLDTAMTTGSLQPLTSNHDFFNCGWNVVINDKDYETVAKNPDGTDAYRGLVAIYQDINQNYRTSSAQKDKIVDENIAPEGTAYADSYLGNNLPSRINDKNSGSLWIAKTNTTPVKVGVEFTKFYPVYAMQLKFETRNTLGANVMDFYIEMLDDKGVWQKVYTGQSYNPKTKSYTINIPFNHPIETKNVRMTYTSNGGIYPALQEMKIFSSKGIQLVEGTSMSIDQKVLKQVPEGMTVGELLNNLYAISGTIQCVENGKVLSNQDIVHATTKVRLINQESVIEELSISFDSSVKNALQDVLNEAKAVKKDRYSAVSFRALQNAIKQAETVFNNPNATIDMYNEQITLVEQAMNNLLDITRFVNLMEILKDQPSTRYNATYYALYQKYYNQAKNIYNRIANASNDQLCKAMNNAELAYNYLIHDQDTNVAPKGTPYAQNQLSNIYHKRNLNDVTFTNCWVAKSKDQYPVYGGVTLDKVYSVDKIKIVFEQNAHRNLQLGFYVSVLTDKNEWKKVYTSKTGRDAGYTFEFDAKGMKIKDVRVTITSYAVDKDTPYPGVSEILVYEKTDSSLLQEAYQTAKAKVENGYNEQTTTKETWATFKEAYDTAAFMLTKTTYSQEAIDAQVKALTDATNALKLDVLEPVSLSATLTDMISLNVYFHVPEKYLTDNQAYVTFTIANGNQTKKVMVKDLQPNKIGLYKVDFALYARQMSDEVTMKVVADQKEKTYTYSIRDYGNKVLTLSTSTKEEKEVVEAMLNYGAMAQIYFNHNIENLANANVTTKRYQDVTADQIKEYAIKTTGNMSGIAYGATNLRLLSETAIRLHFLVDEAIKDQLVFYIENGNQKIMLTPTYYGNGNAYVEIEHIFVERYDHPFVVHVENTQTKETMTVTTSVYSYAYAILQKQDASENMKNVVKAMVDYNRSAKAYKLTKMVD